MRCFPEPVKIGRLIIDSTKHGEKLHSYTNITKKKVLHPRREIRCRKIKQTYYEKTSANVYLFL